LELSDTLDLVIIGYYSGHGSRAEFQFGGLLGAVYNKKRDMFETVSRIGTGFTEKQMAELKEMLSSIQVKSKPARVDSLVEPDFWVYPKYVITVRADEITRSPMHTCGRFRDNEGIESGYALRFPRLVGDTAIRSDKGPEDATETDEVIEMYNGQRKVRLEDK
ncbi:MAG: DNA ligase, partial [Candidatus Marsarchaeota archaeon]|nr:DNA ligase [Candidatus Marsarchaeota archaeon]